jgi:hypothetical protein
MKKLFLLFLVTLPLLMSAQTHDSLLYYTREAGRMMHEAQDSVRKSERYVELQNNIKRLTGKSQDYTGSSFFIGVLHTDYGEFNSSIMQDGFQTMDELAWQFGFGVSTKHSNIMLDMYFASFGTKTKSIKGEEKISMSLSNALQFDFGYDLIKSKSISLYPYAGLSFRASKLEYDAPAQFNPGFTNISNLLINDRSVDASSIRIGYQLGLGFDLLVNPREKKRGGVYLFTKAGMNRPIWKDKYKIDTYKYDPDIRQGDWQIAFGVKLVAWE